LEKAAEYQGHARECRALAAGASSPDHRAALIRMAETSENLARTRVVRLAREVEKKITPAR